MVEIKKCDNLEYKYNYEGKRLHKDEKIGDEVICIDDTDQVFIKEGRIYKISNIEDNWVQLDMNKAKTCYKWNRFMTIADYRECVINRIIKQ